GTITVVPAAARPRLELISYGPAGSGPPERSEHGSVRELPVTPAGHTVRWLNVSGLGDQIVLKEIGEQFGIHELALEDIAGGSQRPKVEPYGDFLFIVLPVPVRDADPETEVAP